MAVSNEIDLFVGERIRSTRESRGLTQTQLAHRIGVSYQMVQKYETGVNRVAASRLFDIATVLHVPPGYFFPRGASGGRK